MNNQTIYSAINVKRVKAILIPGLLLLGTALCCCHKSAPCESETTPLTTTFENAIQLTTDRDDIWPAWSFKGHKIAFERRGYIYTVDVASGSVLFIAQGSTPTLCPQSDQVTFVWNTELYKSPPLKKLTIDARASDISGISWSSDESKIAFFRLSNDGFNRDLWVYQPSTNEFHRLAGSIGWCEYPCWSPDNENIIFLSENEGICIINYKTRALTYLLRDVIFDALAWWSEKNRILYTAGGSLYSISPDGDDSKKLIEGNFYPKSISCERYGNKLAFSYAGIWVMDLLGLE